MSWRRTKNRLSSRGASTSSIKFVTAQFSSAAAWNTLAEEVIVYFASQTVVCMMIKREKTPYSW